MNTNRKSIPAMKIAWFGLSLTLVCLIIWVRFSDNLLGTSPNTHPSQQWLILAAYCLLSLCLSNFINVNTINQKQHYRRPFFAVTALGVFLTVASPGTFFNIQRLIVLSQIALSSFLGTFFASNLGKGWWENNAPPSPQIEKEVLAWHQPYMKNRDNVSIYKRLLDITLALVSILISMPIWIIIMIVVWWEDPGPVLFVKNSVGQGGVNFKQLKFRSMITNAEKDTGPISGYEEDERVLFIGKFIRKTALDELPQLINILFGDMSYVGPRPQRTVLVHEYLQSLPGYAARHQVRPGLAGLAQVADSYDISPEEKLAWDLVYINKENMWLDLKLAFSAFFLVFVLRWRSGANDEKTIRKLLDIEKPDL